MNTIIDPPKDEEAPKVQGDVLDDDPPPPKCSWDFNHVFNVTHDKCESSATVNTAPCGTPKFTFVHQWENSACQIIQKDGEDYYEASGELGAGETFESDHPDFGDPAFAKSNAVGTCTGCRSAQTSSKRKPIPPAP